MKSAPGRVWYLRQTGLLDRLSQANLGRLARLSEIPEYGHGEMILRPEPRPDVIYLIKAGRVKIFTSSTDGKEEVVALLDSGDVFGEIGSVESLVPVRVEALDRAVLCILPRAVFEEIIRNTPDVALQAVRVLVYRLRAAEQEIEDLALRAVPGRLARLLLRLVKEYGERRDSGRLSFGFTNEDLALMIGATCETVTTIMNRWRDDHMITLQQGTLIVRDCERLSAVAQLQRA